MTAKKDSELLLKLLEEKERREKYNRFSYMYPDADNNKYSAAPSGIVYSRNKYQKHLDFFKAGSTYRQRLFCAGNRVGKSFSGLYELVAHATGNYPEWWEGKKFNRPVKIWIGGFTLEMMKTSVMEGLLGPRADAGSGMLPKERIVRTRVAPGVPDATSVVDVSHVSGGTSTITFKTYESGLEGFAGAAVDLIMLDEEPPLKVYLECLMRTATTNGILYVTFTPDRGFSETVLSFFENGAFREGAVNNKYVTVCGWNDIPHLSDETKIELSKTIPPHLREAKTKGVPYLGSGAIYPILEEEVKCRPFQIPDDWQRCFGLDVGWNRTAAVWLAFDPENKVSYIYDEYYRGQAEPAVHASAIKARGYWIPGVIDKASRGRSQVDGVQLIQVYRELGLDLLPSLESKTVDSGLVKTLQLLSNSQLKVFSTCQHWFEEYRIYRRDENGKIIKTNDHLMDATRYVIEHKDFLLKTNPDFEDDTISNFNNYRSGRDPVTGY
jgi:phage terminase large subunit-like protein